MLLVKLLKVTLYAVYVNPGVVTVANESVMYPAHAALLPMTRTPKTKRILVATAAKDFIYISSFSSLSDPARCCPATS
jgi:hypothetical protein